MVCSRALSEVTQAQEALKSKSKERNVKDHHFLKLLGRYQLIEKVSQREIFQRTDTNFLIA